jgi:hypothetical protein
MTVANFLNAPRETLCSARLKERRFVNAHKIQACCSAQIVAPETTMVLRWPQTPEKQGFRLDTGFHGIAFLKGGLDKFSAVA